MARLYEDNSDRIVIPKASKIGITEFLICDMRVLAEAGLNGMYVLPDQPIRNRFISSRVDPIFTRTEDYRNKVGTDRKGVDAKGLKTICGAVWAFVGANNPKTFYEFDADVIIYDEYDLINPDSLAVAGDRTGAARTDMWRKIGNPTAPGMGVWQEFEKSDKKTWHIRCDHCNEMQPLEWDVQFVEQRDNGRWYLRDEGHEQQPDARPICRKCGQPLDRLSAGEWVAEYPGREVSGYHATRLFGAPGNDNADAPRPIIREEFAKFQEALGNQVLLQIFYNNRLGLPYVNRDESLNPDVLDQCRGDYQLPAPKTEGARTIAGIDQGKNFHVSISEIWDGVRHKKHLATCRTWAEVKSLLDAANCVCVVVDAQGGGYAETREFVATREDAYMCYYRSKDQVSGLYNLDEEKGVVQTNRTEILDLMVHSYRDGRVVVPSNYPSIVDGAFKRQMLVPSRILDPGGRPIWTKGEDHFFHADAYELLALHISGMRNSVMPKATSWRV